LLLVAVIGLTRVLSHGRRATCRAKAMIVNPAVASKIVACMSRRNWLRGFGGSWSAVCIVFPSRGRRRSVRFWESAEGNGCDWRVAMWWGFGLLMGLRFCVDGGFMACNVWWMRHVASVSYPLMNPIYVSFVSNAAWTH